MKKISKFLVLTMILLLFLSLVIGCSSTNLHSKDSSVQNNLGYGGSRPENDSKDEEKDSAEDGEKLIVTMSLSFETTEFEKTTEKLDATISKYKAYMEESNISYDRHYDGKSYRYGDFTIRVPKADLSKFKSELSGIGNLISENTYKEDVTKSYKDTESRLKIITTKEERILALLEKANKIEDIIALENQLGEVIYEKESLKSSLIKIDDQVEYSTLHMGIREVSKLQSQETTETKFLTKIKNAFANSLYGFNVAIQDFIIWLIYSLPFIVIFIVLAYLLVKLFKKIRKNKS